MLTNDPDKKLSDEVVPSISSTHRLQWEKVQDCYVILYPEGMVKLGTSAAEILKLCDGENDLSIVVERLQQQFPGADLKQDVIEFLEVAHENGWVQYT